MIPARLTVVAGLVLTALLALAVSAPLSAQAQDGGVQSYEESAGPYQIGINVAQSTLSLGTVLIFVTVTELESGLHVPDARVVLRTLHEATGKEGSATAHNTPRLPERYDAQLNLYSPGTWRLTVEVSSSLGSVGVEVPPLEVPKMQQFSSGTIVFAAIFAAIIGVSAYLFWKYKRGRVRRGPPGRQEEQTGSNGPTGSGTFRP